MRLVSTSMGDHLVIAGFASNLKLGGHTKPNVVNKKNEVRR